MDKLHKLFVKYDSNFCLELQIRQNPNRRVVGRNEEVYINTDQSVILNDLSWPTCIYYNDKPPILNNIKPCINNGICIYKIPSNSVGIILNLPKYIIKNNKTNIFDNSELKTLKSDIRDIVKMLYLNSQTGQNTSKHFEVEATGLEADSQGR